jgi:multidrug resistance efflux pump
MKPIHKSPSSPGRRHLFFLVVGLAVLAASMAGASWVLHSPGLDSAAPNGSQSPSAGAHFEQSVVCFGHVDVEPGVTSLYPVQTGRVIEVLVREGAQVKPGAVLLRVDDRLARLRVQEAEADVKAAEAQLAQIRKLPEQHEAKVAQQKAVIEATQRRLSAARHVLARKRELQKIQQLSAEEVGAAGDQVTEVEAAERGEQAKLRELDSLEPAVTVARAEADLAAKQARLEQARYALDECALRAPAAGTVLRVLVGVGELLGPQPKQPVMLFCPDQPRLIRAEVEQEFAGRVALGQGATIQDDSGASGAWRGKVVRISDWYTQRRSILQEPLQFNDVRTLECIIELEPGQPPLRIGQRVRVTLGK